MKTHAGSMNLSFQQHLQLIFSPFRISSRHLLCHCFARLENAPHYCCQRVKANYGNLLYESSSPGTAELLGRSLQPGWPRIRYSFCPEPTFWGLVPFPLLRHCRRGQQVTATTAQVQQLLTRLQRLQHPINMGSKCLSAHGFPPVLIARTTVHAPYAAFPLYVTLQSWNNLNMRQNKKPRPQGTGLIRVATLIRWCHPRNVDGVYQHLNRRERQ